MEQRFRLCFPKESLACLVQPFLTADLATGPSQESQPTKNRKSRGEKLQPNQTPQEHLHAETALLPLYITTNLSASAFALGPQVSVSQWKVSRYAHHWHNDKNMARQDMYLMYPLCATQLHMGHSACQNCILDPPKNLRKVNPFHFEAPQTW